MMKNSWIMRGRFAISFWVIGMDDGNGRFERNVLSNAVCPCVWLHLFGHGSVSDGHFCHFNCVLLIVNCNDMVGLSWTNFVVVSE